MTPRWCVVLWYSQESCHFRTGIPLACRQKDPQYSPLFLWQTHIAHGSSDALAKTQSAVLIREYIMCMLTWMMITRCSSHKTDPQATKSISAYLVFVTCSSLLEIDTLPWWSSQLNTEQASWFAAHKHKIYTYLSFPWYYTGSKHVFCLFFFFLFPCSPCALSCL